MIRLWLGLYRLGLLLLPRDFREDAGAAMLGDLASLLRDAPGPGARIRRALHALSALPAVALAEHRYPTGPAGAGPYPTTRTTTMDALGKDLSFALRSLARARAFTVAAVLLLAVGIGAVTASFTLVDQVLLRPLPYPAADRLVYMTNGSHPGPMLRELDGVEAFDEVALWSGDNINLTRDEGEPLRLLQHEVNAPFWSVFGARPVLGRLLVAADEPGVAVLDHGTWTRVFGADPEIVGRAVRLGEGTVEVVGVLAAEFQPPQALGGDRPDLYRPMDWANAELDSPNIHRHSVAARLAPGVTVATADTQIDVVGDRLRERFPEDFVTREGAPERWPLVPLAENATADVSGGLWILLGAVALLLLVGCTNVAHLVLARALSRDREMAVRRALGASTATLSRQLFIENVLLGLAGGAAGLLLAAGALGAFRTWTTLLPRGGALGMDLRVAGVGLGTAVLTSLAFGMVPALRSLGRDLRSGLNGAGRGLTGGRRIHALRGSLVVAEVALSLVLVALAGVLMRSFVSVTAQDPGIDPTDVVAIPVTLSGIDTPEIWNTRMEEMRRALLEVPGVQAATYGLEMPFEFNGGNRCCWSTRVRLPGEAEDASVRAMVHGVHEDFYEVVGLDFVAGGAPEPGGGEAAAERMVISESMAVRLFGSAQAAVGQRFVRGQETASVVVGVVADTRHYGMDQEHDVVIYVAASAVPFPIPMGTLAVRTAPGSGVDGGALRQAVWSVAPDQPLPTLASMEEWITASSSLRRFASLLSGTFGVVALLLAAGGLYGTLLYTVRARRRELGIRMALGASARRVRGDVVRRGMALAAAGAVIGVAAAWFATRLLEPLVWGVAPQDPATLAGAAAVLLATAFAASWLPALRASRTSPLETLGAE